MTREDALYWAIKYISRRARKSHVDYDEYVRRTKYIVNKLYDDFEQRIAELEAPKSCDGCEDEFIRGTADSLCHICSRGYDDMFSPKGMMICLHQRISDGITNTN